MAELLETIGPRAGSSPLTHTLNELGTVEIESAFAHLDGSAALQRWRPALTIRAQDGTILSRTFPGDVMAAGDVADVTWFPGFVETAVSGAESTPYATLIGELAAVRNLLGYWKLSEAASPFADTSGNAGGAANMTTQAGTTPMTTQVAGALPAGQDSFAVRFNTANNASGDWLRASNARFGLTGTASFSLTAFAKPIADANTWRGQVLGNMHADLVAPNFADGFAIFVDWPTRDCKFIRTVQSGVSQLFDSVSCGTLTTAAYTFLGATYNAFSSTMTIYANGTPVASTTSTLSTVNTTFFEIGHSQNDPTDYSQPLNFLRPGWFYGAIDECGFWGGVISDSEMLALAVAAGYA